MWTCIRRTVSDVARRPLLRIGAARLVCAFLIGFSPCSAFCQDAAESTKPKEALPGRIFMNIRGRGARQVMSIALDPNDQTWTKLPETDSAPGRVAPDGRRMLVYMRPVAGGKPAVAVIDLEGEKAAATIEAAGTRAIAMIWSPDGKSAIVSQPTTSGVLNRFETWKCAIDGSTRTKLPIAETEWVIDGSSDGRWFVALSTRPPWDQGTIFVPRPVYLYRSDGTGERLLIEVAKEPKRKDVTGFLRFSPDSRTILYNVQKLEEVDGQTRATSQSLWLVGVDGKERRCIVEGSSDRYPLIAAWSPDSKRLAVGIWEKAADAGAAFVPLGRGKASAEIIDLRGRTLRHLNLPIEAPICQIFDWR